MFRLQGIRNLFTIAYLIAGKSTLNLAPLPSATHRNSRGTHPSPVSATLDTFRFACG
jgi:hypothetical protein